MDTKLVSYKGYWHLCRKVNDIIYLGFSDHRIGLSIKVADSPIGRERPFKEDQSYTVNGVYHSYVDEPYTISQINSFNNLSEEELNIWIKRGN